MPPAITSFFIHKIAIINTLSHRLCLWIFFFFGIINYLIIWLSGLYGLSSNESIIITRLLLLLSQGSLFPLSQFR